MKQWNYFVDGITLTSNGAEAIVTNMMDVSMDMDYSMGGDMGMVGGEVNTPKDPLLSSWIFVIGISVITLAISVGVGILMAKGKIKKGFELYED